MPEISEERLREIIREEIARREVELDQNFIQSIAEGIERQLPRLMDRVKERRA